MISFTEKIIIGLLRYFFSIFYRNNLGTFSVNILMLTNVDKKVPKSSEHFYCEKCDYITSRRSQYDRHLLTLKHQNVDKMLTNVDNLVPKSSTAYMCSCGKGFAHRQSLSVHKKRCVQSVNSDETFQPITKELVIQLLKQNSNLQLLLQEQSNKMYELAKEGKNIMNTTNNNTHFNLNVFLNEKCKDAINLMDFVNSLQVKMKDLENTAKMGYAEGISNILINRLNELEVHKRPIHCSDLKREILYIKDEDLWEKEDEDRTKLTKAIRIIGSKNMSQISEWQKVNPEYNNPESKESDRYMKMICNVMSGSTKEEQKNNIQKVIRNIAKEVVIDKNKGCV